MSKHKPFTVAQRTARRMLALNRIARAAGWKSWTVYATAVKRGLVKIAVNPEKEKS